MNSEIINPTELLDRVLDEQCNIPSIPGNNRQYIDLDHAFSIVDETLVYLKEHGDPTEYTYLSGHRKRLAHTLSTIPKAANNNSSCLDVGSYGYMLLWAKKHLGYERVVGIEWHPENQQEVIKRTLRVNEYSIEIRSYNFDISAGPWSLGEQFDTILFFEVLEHINEDPMGVMEQINHALSDDGSLIMSVPNCISYKSLREFLIGMPPWTYWFYQPDLKHEPRHCFEYTPIIFQMLIQASGMDINSFNVIYAYTEPEHEHQTLDIAQALGLDAHQLGETMIINSTKITNSVPIRYPDVIYSPDGYYSNVYPKIRHKLQEAYDQFVSYQSLDLRSDSHSSQDESTPDQLDDTLAIDPEYIKELEESNTKLESQIKVESEQSKELITQIEQLTQENNELKSQLNESFFLTDCYLTREEELNNRVDQANSEIQRIESEKAAAMIETKDSRNWAEQLSHENYEMKSQINELLFACDCYLQQVNDTSHCVQVIREQRFRKTLQRTKSIARRTPIIRTALRPVYRQTKKLVKSRMK